MRLQGRQGRRRKLGFTALIALAAAAWAAAITIDALNLDDHLWQIAVVVAGISSLAALQFQLILMLAGILGGVNERLDKAYSAMTKLYAAQPEPELTLTPPPWRTPLHSVGGADDGPSLRNGRPASPGASGA